MPITRRRRANPPDQPENNHHQAADPTEGAVEQPLQTEPAPATPPTESVENVQKPAAEPQGLPNGVEPVQAGPQPGTNGDRSERPERPERPGPEYVPNMIESGRRTARGELFRRPPQAPPQPQGSFVSATPLQAPTHEITLPLGNMLHLAYNPGYTGSDEARSQLLNRLSEESKAGGRARCWNCGSLAIAYDRWSTRSRTFGDVGIAFCEICGVWSVM